jgi:serine/threonine protein phosphatase 1
MWDRTLLNVARIYEKQGHKFENYRIIFVGHTATTGITGGDEPTFFSNLVMTDTGAGWFGKLTVMDVETFEFWQSDKVEELYPEEHVVRVAKRKKRMKEEEMKENLRFFYENEIKKK